MSISEDIISDVLGDRIALAIIRHLYSATGAASGRQIASAIGFSPQATLNALNKLSSSGIVNSIQHGRGKFYSLNMENWTISEWFIPLFKMCASQFEMVGNFYAEKLEDKPLSIVLFGSYAEGNPTEDSDFDLLFIFKTSGPSETRLKDILRLNEDIFNRFGVQAEPKVISAADFKKAVKLKEGFMRNIFLKGKTIWGLPLNEVMTYDRKKN